MHEIYKKQNLPYLMVKLCPNCNELVPVENDICPNCFYNFSSREINLPSSTDTIKINNQVEEKTTILKMPIKEKEEIAPLNEKPSRFLYCECCGAKINDGQVYCGECGARVSKVFCKSCQNLIDATLMFCPFCGNKQEKVLSKIPTQPVASYPANEYQKAQPTIVINTSEHPSTIPTTPQAPITQPIADQIVKEDSSLIQNDSTNLETTSVESEEEHPVINKKDLINMGRKRLFMILQILVVLCIGTLLTTMPLIVEKEGSFFQSILPSFKNIKNVSIIKGYDLFHYLFTLIQQTLGMGTVEKIDPSSLYIDAEKTTLIFGSLPFIGSKLSVGISFVWLVALYGCTYLFLLIALFAAFGGLFTRRPVRGKTIGFVTILLFVFSLLTIVHPIIDKQETIVLYLFVLSFLFWFIEKLVFFRENRRYNKAL